MVTKTGTHKVCKLVTETKTMPVTSTIWEAKTETIQVPVAATSYASAGCGISSGCDTGCGSAKKHCKLFGGMKGLFHHKSGCGCN